MMQFIRSNAGKFVVFPITLAFVGWMVFEIGMQASGTGTGAPGEVGSVNGQPITAQMYQQAVQQIQEQARQQGRALTAEDQLAIDQEAWSRLVAELLVQQELDRRGLHVSDREILDAARTMPAPFLMQQEIFQTNGQFDGQKYQQFLASENASPELLAQLEMYYRTALPQMKLERQLSAGVNVSDAALWRAYQDENETATVEYVSLDLTKTASGEVPVTDAEIERRYREKRDQFERPRTATFTVAYLPTAIDAADRQAALQRAQRLRAEIAGGADFAAVAQRESSDSVSARDGGSLGTVRRGQTVAPFDSAVWRLPVGELSQPVLTDFGYHLIQVTERADTMEAKVRHVLIPISKTEQQQERLDARADSLATLAETMGIERAARMVGAQVRKGVTVTETNPVIPGVGPALEALNWAAAEVQNGDTPTPVSDDAFDSGSALYVAQVERYTPKGRMTLAEATPQIRRDLILEKKRAQARQVGEQIVAEVRAGKSLQQAAAARGLVVATQGPFTRMEPNPVFGQANQAIGAAFGTPVNGVSGVVETTGGLFVIRPTARTTADRAAWEKQKEAQRQAVLFRLRQSTVQRWLDSARRNADIEDNRDKVLGRA